MKVASLQADGQILIEERPVPALGEKDALLKVKACGLCGTDIMKVQRRSAASGTVLGHEVAGDIVAIGSQVTAFKVGDRVVVAHHVPCGQCHYCQRGHESMCPQFKKTNLDPGGFAEYLRIPEEHIAQTAFIVPDSLSYEEASFMEPLACCLRAVHRSPTQTGDRILIVGLGSVGLMSAQLFQLQKAYVSGLDLDPQRLALAASLGVSTFNPAGPLSEDTLFDLVFLTAGGAPLWEKLPLWLKPGGTIHIFASPGTEPIPVDMDAVYHHEWQIIATYSSAPAELKESLALIASGKVKTKPLISTLLPLHEIPKGIEQTLSRQIVKAMICPEIDTEAKG